jgi:hypothetical protein
MIVSPVNEFVIAFNSVLSGLSILPRFASLPVEAT